MVDRADGKFFWQNPRGTAALRPRGGLRGWPMPPRQGSQPRSLGGRAVLPRLGMAALALALAAGCQRAAPVAPDAPPKPAHALADDSAEGAQVHAERTSGQDRPPGQSAAPPGHTPRAGDRTVARQTLMVSITIFVLSIFVGVELITKVPATLHTPLMSGSNAISGITVVGGLIAAGGVGWVACSLGFLAVVLAAINVVGGFLVTHRMLRMFDRR